MENVSFYTPHGNDEMTEQEFVNAVLEEADCDLLIDVNNIYVNSVNHNYDPVSYLKSLPGERIVYAHIAGHFNEDEDLIVDPHGAPVVENVWDLLEVAYQHFGVFPTLLERDFNYPPVPELLSEVNRIKRLQEKYAHNEAQAQSQHSATGQYQRTQAAG